MFSKHVRAGFAGYREQISKPGWILKNSVLISTGTTVAVFGRDLLEGTDRRFSDFIRSLVIGFTIVLVFNICLHLWARRGAN